MRSAQRRRAISRNAVRFSLLKKLRCARSACAARYTSPVDEQGDEFAMEGLRQPRGRPHDARVRGGGGEADQDALAGVVVAVSEHARGVGEASRAVGAAAQCDLAQCREVLDAEEIALRAVGLRRAVHESGLEALVQVLGLDIHELDLVGVIEDAVGDALANDDARDGGHHVVQALDVLDVDRGVDVYAGAQELLDILIALFRAAPRRMGVRELVDEE